MKRYLADETATMMLGRDIAKCCPDHHFTIHLEGDLGAGKTTLTRGLLQYMGHTGHVKSPTYTLIERYDLNNRSLFHFDLYRLTDPEELDYLGLDDYLSNDSICIIEWPKRGSGYLPKPDLNITLDYQNNGRQALITAYTPSGEHLLKILDK